MQRVDIQYNDGDFESQVSVVLSLRVLSIIHGLGASCSCPPIGSSCNHPFKISGYHRCKLGIIPGGRSPCVCELVHRVVPSLCHISSRMGKNCSNFQSAGIQLECSGGMSCGVSAVCHCCKSIWGSRCGWAESILIIILSWQHGSW